MLSTLELLDRAKTAAGAPSDYRLSKLLGVPTQTITNYRSGRSRPENSIAMRLADLCGLDRVEVVAWVNIERAKSADDRELWQTVLERMTTPKRRRLVA